MIWIDGLFEVHHMAGRALCGCAGISGGMTLQTVRAGMCPGQRKGSHAVIKGIISISCGVASQAGGTIVGVSRNAIVVIIRLRIHVAGDAGKLCIIGRIGMAVDTGIPFAFVFATVDREVLAVMIECCWDPTRFAVASCTVGREHQCPMVRIDGLVIVGLMASGTGGWSVEIISIVTYGAIVGDQRMRPIQRIEIIVIGEERRIPVWISGMTGRAIHGKSEFNMIGVDSLIEVLGMTGRAFGRRTGIACRMTGSTIHIEMTPGQWEGGHVVIEHIACITGGVAGQARSAIIGIASNPGMCIIRLRIHVTGGTRKYLVVARVGMTLCTSSPFSLVFAGVDREIRSVVILIGGRHPTRIGRMARGTIRRKSGLNMIGILGGLEIGLMAGHTLGGSVLVAAIGMTLGAIGDGVTQGQWKKTVVHLICIPIDLIDVVAFRTVGGKVVLDVIRARGRLKILEVAIDAVISQSVETKSGLGLVTVKTGDGRVGADQWETVIKMDLGDIIHQPVVGRMTSRTILTYGLLMDVDMTRNTFSRGLGEDHRCMTGLAVDKGVLSFQTKSGGLVIEEEVFPQGLPSGRSMAVGTTDGQLFAMG